MDARRCSGIVVRMFDVLVYLYENYWRPDACPDHDQLTRKLSAVGFESDEIQEALRWLDGLATSQRAEAVDIVLAEFFGSGAVDQLPQLFGTTAGQRVFHLDRTTQTDDIFRTVVTFNPSPAWIGVPVMLNGCNALFASRHIYYLVGRRADDCYGARIMGSCSEGLAVLPQTSAPA